MRPNRLFHSPENFIAETLDLCEEIQESILKSFERAPNTIKTKITHPSKPTDNPQRVFDSQAEESFRNYMQGRFQEPLDVIGEEDPRLPVANYTTSQTTFMLVDMIDGSDLLINGFGNWCSAVVCVVPREKKILMAVVAHANGCK